MNKRWTDAEYELRAATRQDAEERAADIEAAEKRGYDCGVNDIVRQDAEERARMRSALEPFAVMAEAFKPLSENKCVSVHPTVGDLRRARAALACGADPMHCVLDELVRSARHVSNIRKPWSDNNYGRAASALAWCLPSDDARHPNNGGPWNGDDIACRPQGEKS